jgi:hypothetical protein
VKGVINRSERISLSRCFEEKMSLAIDRDVNNMSVDAPRK